jgi:hypothetical protein
MLTNLANWFEKLLRKYRYPDSLSYLQSGARICKRLGSPRIDFEDLIPPAYVALRAGTTNRTVVPARQAGNRFLGSLKGLEIRALAQATIQSIPLVVTIKKKWPHDSEHPNIVKFHRYWTDQGTTDEKTGITSKPRVIFRHFFYCSGVENRPDEDKEISVVHACKMHQYLMS